MPEALGTGTRRVPRSERPARESWSKRVRPGATSKRKQAPTLCRPTRPGRRSPTLGPSVITMATGWEESAAGEPVLGRPAVGPGGSELGGCPSPACPPTPIRVSWAETVQDVHGDNTGTQRLPPNSRDRAELRPKGASSGGARRGGVQGSTSTLTGVGGVSEQQSWAHPYLAAAPARGHRTHPEPLRPLHE